MTQSLLVGAMSTSKERYTPCWKAASPYALIPSLCPLMPYVPLCFPLSPSLFPLIPYYRYVLELIGYLFDDSILIILS